VSSITGLVIPGFQLRVRWPEDPRSVGRADVCSQRQREPPVDLLDLVQRDGMLQEPVRVAIRPAARGHDEVRRRLEAPQCLHGTGGVAVDPDNRRLADEILPTAAAPAACDHPDVDVPLPGMSGDLSRQLPERIDSMKRLAHPRAAPEAQLDERVARRGREERPREPLDSANINRWNLAHRPSPSEAVSRRRSR
jgi:hypothetical protein